MHLIITILLTSIFGIQGPGPKLFNSLPDEIHISASNMGSLLTSESIGNKITLNTQNTAPLSIELFNYTKWNDKEKTVAYKLIGYPEGTTLIINIIQRNGQTIYRGHIKNMIYSDAFTINFNGSELILKKTDREEIVAE